jgi:signal peptide peptidase SppA
MPKVDKTYAHAFNYCSEMPWAILRSKLVEIQTFILKKTVAGGTVEIGKIKAKDKPRASQPGDVMVLPLFGTISKRADLLTQISGGTSIENFTKSFREAVANPGVKAIVINIDSPGGGVFGVAELADEIYNARGDKHIVAIANDMAASAAYWIGSAADEFVVTPSGLVGSIGVYTIHEDWSEAYKQAGISSTVIQAGKYKTEGIELMPLTEEARAEIQKSVDFYYDTFVASVAKGRGTTVAYVKNQLRSRPGVQLRRCQSRRAGGSCRYAGWRAGAPRRPGGQRRTCACKERHG